MKRKSTTIALVVGIVAVIALGLFRITAKPDPERMRHFLVAQKFIPKTEPQYVSGFSPEEVFPDGTASEWSSTGRWQIIFTGYTYCPDICPITLRQLAVTQSELTLRYNSGRLPIETDIYMLAIDPERDTPAVLAKHVRGFHSDLLSMWLPQDRLSASLRVLGVAQPTQRDQSKFIDHSGQLTVIDPQGRIVGYFRQGASSSGIVDVMSKLLTICVIPGVGKCNA